MGRSLDSHLRLTQALCPACPWQLYVILPQDMMDHIECGSLAEGGSICAAMRMLPFVGVRLFSDQKLWGHPHFYKQALIHVLIGKSNLLTFPSFSHMELLLWSVFAAPSGASRCLSVSPQDKLTRQPSFLDKCRPLVNPRSLLHSNPACSKLLCFAGEKKATNPTHSCYLISLFPAHPRILLCDC